MPCTSASSIIINEALSCLKCFTKSTHRKNVYQMLLTDKNDTNDNETHDKKYFSLCFSFVTGLCLFQAMLVMQYPLVR